MIRQTSFAVSTSETRPILTGVNWKIENDELNCIATDSHRFALRKAKIEMEITWKLQCCYSGKKFE